MLMQLNLKDFAVVSASELGFSPGFTVVTGETGAGKSLLVDALLCLTGARADVGMVRHGAQRAELSAEFNLEDAPQAVAWLTSQEYDEQQDCVIRRVIRADGGSKAWINGRSATLSQLAELGACLLEIHGQHEQQNLLERHKQMDLLDEFAQHGALKKQLQQSQREWSAIKQELNELQARGDVADQILYLSHQLRELQLQPLEPEFIQDSLAKHKRHSQSTQLISACSAALALLGNDDNASALHQLRASINQLSRWQTSEPVVAEVISLLESADIQIKEANSQLEHWQAHIELDEHDSQQLDGQISHWHELSRKHRVPIEQLQAKAQLIEQQLLDLSQANSRVAHLQTALQEAQKVWLSTASLLSQQRSVAAIALSAAVSGFMAELGMSGGTFSVQFNPNESDSPTAYGLERCEFLVSANPGQPARALRKVASGGELARISLAIEVATLGLDPTPSMIFDEVDSGIGGAVAEVVGQKLRALGAQCQVLCVTHLAQVASLGHQHYQVFKRIQGDSTESLVAILDKPQRIEEIARMMGGVALSEQSRAHAEQMLNSALL
jgi:DNA repair protein RecN (Recombination protein N)